MKRNIWITGAAAAAVVAAGTVWYMLRRKHMAEGDKQKGHGKENPHPGVEHLHRINKKAKQALG